MKRPLAAWEILHLIARYPCGCELCEAFEQAKRKNKP